MPAGEDIAGTPVAGNPDTKQLYQKVFDWPGMARAVALRQAFELFFVFILI